MLTSQYFAYLCAQQNVVFFFSTHYTPLPTPRPDHMNSASKNPVIIASNESESCEGIKEPIFDVVKETAELKPPQDGSGCSFLTLFEEECQPIHNNPSTKHFNPFSNQSNTDFFFTVSDIRSQITNSNYSYDTRKVHPAINAKENSVDRQLEGIFTAPERVFLKSNTVSRTSYKETGGLQKTHLQNCHEGQHYFISCEKKEKRANLEKIGACHILRTYILGFFLILKTYVLITRDVSATTENDMNLQNAVI